MVPHSIPDGPSGIRMDPFTVSSRLPFMHNLEHVAASSSVPATTGSSSGSIPHYTSHTHQMGSIAGAGSLFLGSQISEAAVRGASLHVGQEVPTSLFEGSLVQ
uniref:Uncharacterized protein n=1 Tax=Arundo donax TaxID=35708 RepID=A0A0A9GUU5_ARUDO